MSIFEQVRPMILDLFAAYDGGPNGSYGIQLNTNTTGDAGLSVEMKTYYSDYLIDLAEAELVHDQFGQKHPIPKNGGKTIEFRQYDTLPELLTPLTEGVTPNGQSLSVKNLTATVAQYGGYVTISDVLQLTAIDNNILQATKLIASQGGRTSDGITRDKINAGTNVHYAQGGSSREALAYTSSVSNNNLKVDDIKRVVRYLETQNAPKINGDYVGIIHPMVKYDLMNDPLWQNPHTYVDTDHIYRNEIGKIYGVRFVESSRAKVWSGDVLAGGKPTLTVASAVTTSATVPVAEKITAAEATALAGKTVYVGSAATEVTISSATAGNAGSASLTLSASTSIAKDTVLYGQGAGVNGVDVYSTLIIADDAYGVTEVSGGGMQHIVKQLGSAGSADPLNQRATVGFKLLKTAEILVPQYIVRIESTATP